MLFKDRLIKINFVDIKLFDNLNFKVPIFISIRPTNYILSS